MSRARPPAEAGSRLAGAAVAACAAVAAFALPFKLHIVVAIAAAVAVGILLDHLAPAPAVTKVEKRA